MDILLIIIVMVLVNLTFNIYKDIVNSKKVDIPQMASTEDFSRMISIYPQVHAILSIVIRDIAESVYADKYGKTLNLNMSMRANIPISEVYIISDEAFDRIFKNEKELIDKLSMILSMEYIKLHIKIETYNIISELVVIDDEKIKLEETRELMEKEIFASREEDVFIKR